MTPKQEAAFRGWRSLHRNKPRIARTAIQGISDLPGQLELGGCEHEPSRRQLQRKADAPLKPEVPQKAPDHGLFSDDARQLDLVERIWIAPHCPPEVENTIRREAAARGQEVLPHKRRAKP